MKAVDHKCPNCNAVLMYNPKGKNWKCEYCSSTFTLEDLEANEAKFEKTKVDEKSVENLEMDEYTCSNCGAKIVADSNTAATFCVYCKNTAILKSRLTSKFAPDKIIPFTKSKEDAIAAFKSIGKGKLFMPNEFSNTKNINEIKGVYIPFWLYSCKARGRIKGTGTKVTSWSTYDYHFTKTDTYEVEREKIIPFNNVPTDGSTRFDDAIMNSIEPFDYNELIDFNSSYLSGFLAERYDVEKETAKVDSINRAKVTGYSAIMSDVPYTGFVRKEEEFKPIEESITYALLPVYMVNIKYNDKFYTFAMNGETGKMIGDIPYSKSKALKYYILVFFISFIIIGLLGFLFLYFMA